MRCAFCEFVEPWVLEQQFIKQNLPKLWKVGNKQHSKHFKARNRPNKADSAKHFNLYESHNSVAFAAWQDNFDVCRWWHRPCANDGICHNFKLHPRGVLLPKSNLDSTQVIDCRGLMPVRTRNVRNLSIAGKVTRFAKSWITTTWFCIEFTAHHSSFCEVRLWCMRCHAESYFQLYRYYVNDPFAI